LVVLSVGLAAVAVGGCGRNDFANDPRPAVPAEVSVKMANDGIVVSPKEFGSGLVNFTIANLTETPGTLVIQGPINAQSPEVIAEGTATLKIDMDKSGDYEASADGIDAAPFSFTVGPPRPSGKNDLLLP
jgi:hypothetical protein